MFENFHAGHSWRREWTGRNSRGFPKKSNERILRKWQQTYLEKLLCLLQSFCYKDQRRKDRNDFQTETGFEKTPALHVRAKTYCALSFDRINVFNMANLFSLCRKPFVMCYCFCKPMKTFFFDASQMTAKSRVLHLFSVPQTGRHIINILLASFFRSVL